ncbi:MFS transporter [Nonomuraea sp. B10E15]|uniref:MFS transporter n=1 Tax=Nonomuraea sp. B10E15 TaxID=3153560 RepID=UPI00325CB7A7
MTETDTPTHVAGPRVVRIGTCVAMLAAITVGGRITDAAVLMAAAVPGSAISLSITGLAAGIPFLLAGGIGRLLLLARLSPRAAILLGSALGALAGVALATGLADAGARPFLVYAPLVVVTIANIIVNATWMSSLPEILPDLTRRRRTIGITATVTSAGAAAGPAIAGLSFGFLDLSGLCLLYASTSAAGGIAMAVAIGALSPADQPETTGADRPDRFGGVRDIVRSRRARGPVLVQVSTNLIVFGVIYSLPVRAVQEAWPPSWVAIGMAALMSGTIAGSLLATVAPSHRLYATALRLEPLFRAIMLLLFAFAADGYPAWLCLFLFSLPQGFGRVARQSMMTEEFGAANRLQVMATYRGMLGASMVIAPFVMERGVDLIGTFGYTLSCAVALTTLFVLQVVDTPKGERP